MFGDRINFDLDGFADIHPYFPTHIDLNLQGTLLNDILIGSSGQDFLNGGPGDDLLIGGEGGDVYVLDSLGDIVQENGSNDLEDDPDDVRDSIVAAFSVNLTLDAVKYANIEDVRVISDADVVIVGNEGNNRLTSDAGNDTLIAMGGSDDLWGRGGNDILNGGDGDDWYYFGIGDGFDQVIDSDGDDLLILIGDLDLYSAIRTTGSGDDLLVTLEASGEQLVIQDWFLNGRRIENIQGAREETMDSVDILRAVSNLGVTAQNDAVTITEDAAANGSVLGNDSDLNSDPLTLTSTGVFQGTYGSVQFFANGTYAYTTNAAAQALAAGATVQDTFAYTVSDRVKGNTMTATANLVVTVNGRNDAPVTTADSGSVAEDGAQTATGNVLANDSDVDNGAVLRVAAPGNYAGTYGTLSLAQNGSYTYTLNNGSAAVQGLRAGQTASDVFAYAASDGLAQTAGTLTISVAGRNDGPVAVANSGSVAEDGVQTASGNVLANDTDIDAGTTLQVVAPGSYAGTYGTLSLAQNGSYTYTLSNGAAAVQALRAGQTVSDAFSYTATDGSAQSSSALTISISGANDAPTTAADSGNVSEDGVLTATGNVLANDRDVDTGASVRVAAPGSFTGAYGTLSLAQNGAYTYTLNNSSAATQGLRAGQTANDVFTYAATDGTAQSNGTLTIGVAGANDAAVVSAPIADQSVTAGAAFSFAFAANTFTDPDGDALSYSARLADGSALPSWLAFNATTRTFSGTPVAGAGTLQVRVTAADASGAAVTDQFALSVQGGSTSPTVGDLVVGTRGNDVLTGTAFGDVIDGREGVDRMSGGKGDDFYFVDATRVNGNDVVDTVVELANEGYDTVFADADYTLAANVEELRLLGHGHLEGTGNTLNNVLVGNDGDNNLSGGAGSDTYVYELHGGDDVIDEKGTANQTDTMKLEGVAAGTVRLKQSGNNLVIDFPGRDGTVTIKNWFSSSASRVERFVFDDGTVWDESAIRSRVGKTVKAVKDDDYCGSDRNDHDHHDNYCDDDRSDRDDDCGDRGGNSSNATDEAILKRLNAPVRFSFDAITRALGKPSGSLSASDIAQRWAAVRGYSDGLGDGDGHHDSAEFPSMSKLLTLSGQGSGFGFEGSTGSNNGSNDFKCFEGLGEGFRKL